jgi:hypothetical protein
MKKIILTTTLFSSLYFYTDACTRAESQFLPVSLASISQGIIRIEEAE